MDVCQYYEDIVDIMQNRVTFLCETLYGNDKCKPKYTVSILFEEDLQKIIISIEHAKNNFSRVLFPVKDMYYGYESLAEIMVSMYNQTM